MPANEGTPEFHVDELESAGKRLDENCGMIAATQREDPENTEEPISSVDPLTHVNLSIWTLT